jgi:hypothetical protein
MQHDSPLLKYTMTYGLYLGLAFSFSVFLMHLFGSVHSPGDEIGLFNSLLLSFAMLVLGRKYRDTHFPDQFLYRQAFGFMILLSLFAAFIYSVFSYWYYAVLEPKGIELFIEQMRKAYSDSNNLPAEQVEALVSLYKKALTPGTMAFIVFLYQAIVGVMFGLLTAVFVKTPIRYEK